MDAPPQPPRRWPAAKRALFRFACLYFTLYVIPFPLSWVPWQPLEALDRQVQDVWHEAVVWTGEHVLRLEEPITVRPRGSGDTTWNYVQLLLIAVFATLGTLVWSAVAWGLREREEGPRARAERRGLEGHLAPWLSIGCRYYLAFVLSGYGLAKVIKTQFPFPTGDRLVEAYGDSSPMGLLWTFMGYSTPYNVFAGLAEALAGWLLLFRHTVTVGALLAIAVMGNIVVLNFSYDVPVKLYSTHLLVFAVALLLPDLGRFVSAFVRNRTTPPADLRPPVRGLAADLVRWPAKLTLIGYLLYEQVDGQLESQSTHGLGAEKPPLHGLYLVETYEKDGAVVDPSLLEADRWRTLSVDWPGYATVRTMGDSLLGFAFEPELSGEVELVRIASTAQPDEKNEFTLQRPEEGLLVLEGELLGSQLRVGLRRKDAEEFLLVNRGFRWINEYPFNR